MPRSTRRILVALLGLSAAWLLPTGFLSAQGVPSPVPYDVRSFESRFSTGCLEPSPCDCLAIEVGPVSGGFRIEPLPGSLGPIFEYQILDLDMSYTTDLAPVTTVAFTGGGLLLVDAASGTVEVSLELSFDGAPPRTFETLGAIPQNSEFPSEMIFDVFHQIDSCLFDGIRIRAQARGRFIRGDANEDGMIDIGDAVRSLTLVIPPGPTGPPTTPECQESLDANGDGNLNIADPIYLLNWIFAGGTPPGAPFPDCGPSPHAPSFQVPCDQDAPNCV